MIEYKVRVYDDRTEWFLNEKWHREDGPAYERSNGDRIWYLNGKKNRKDSPAVECANGDKAWYLNGKLHRIDGPAVEYANGDKEWYLNGKKVTKKEVMNKNEKVYTTEELKNMTLEEIFNIVGKKS